MGRPDDRATIANSREAALPVWQQVMTSALNGNMPAPFNQVSSSIASNLSNARVCSATGVAAAGTNCAPQRNEYIEINHPPPNPSQGQGLVISALVDSWTGQLANDFCQDNAIQMQFTRLIPRDPGAVQWLNTGSGQPTATRMGLPRPVQEVPTQACQSNTEIPVAVISAPADNGAALTGTVQILGIASAPNFGSYQLEIAPVGTQNFTRIAGPVTIPHDTQNSVLADWNTATVSNGQYTLRLTMTAQNGVGYVQRQITVSVQNQPTPTPTLPFTLTPVIITTDTTVPFFPTDTPFGAESQSFGAVTPTPTITIGG